ncbi:MAG: B12-binding domain-containing radical SAM protein [Thermoplasmata archaeon]
MSAPVILTSENAIASDAFGSSIAGFISALPDAYMKRWISDLYFRVKRDRNNLPIRVPYGLAKVQASLKRVGIESTIVDPKSLKYFIGPETKILGIYTMDGLGLSYGSGITYWIIKLAGLPYTGIPYISRSFLDIFDDPTLKKYKDQIKIVVGGPAVWQLIDTDYDKKLNLTLAYDGEFEIEGPALIKNILAGNQVPQRYLATRPVPVSEIPPIITPANGGLVEVTRGCGRGCKFCMPTISGMIRSIPFENIEKEIKLNLEHGEVNGIGLHSEEFFRYGVKGIDPDPEKVTELVKRAYRLVKSYGDYNISTDFTTAAVVVQNPKMVAEVSQYMNEGNRKNFIEMGIETGSPKMIETWMPGKVLPFKAQQYPEIIEKAIGTLNDNGWIVVGTMIVNLPNETEQDIMLNMELLDRLKNYRVITFPLPFIPMGALRNRDFTALDKMLEDPLRGEFIAKALYQAFEEANRDRKMVSEGMDNPFAAAIVERLINIFMTYLTRKYSKQIENYVQNKGSVTIY